MGRAKPGPIASERQQRSPSEQYSTTRKRKNANKKALRRDKSYASVLSQKLLATYSNPAYIREQRLCQRGSRHAEELTELRNKRCWVQGQVEDKNIDGNTACELLKLYNKTFAGKPQGQRPTIEDMSEGAKLVNMHLEHAIKHKLGFFGNATSNQSQDLGSTAEPVSSCFDEIDGVNAEDEEEEWNGFSSDEEE